MRLLLVNDDGASSPGIVLLAEELSAAHEVWVVAPDGERSCSSHAATLKSPIMVAPAGERSWTCSGTPVDCVIAARAMGIVVDAVVSGINAGPNIGTDVVFSGTAAAARQAAMAGWPGIALSINTRKAPFPFRDAARRALPLIEELVPLWRPGIFFNVNFPAARILEAPVEFCSLSLREYLDFHRKEELPDGGYALHPLQSEIRTTGGAGSDHDALARGAVAVSAVPINAEALSPGSFGAEALSPGSFGAEALSPGSFGEGEVREGRGSGCRA